jgi:hypothetical protein
VRASTSADGDLELRYRPPGPTGMSSGVIGGTGHDFLSKGFAPERARVTVKGSRADEPGVTDVRLVASVQTAIGTVTNSAILFETPLGRVTCEQARWILRPATF